MKNKQGNKQNKKKKKTTIKGVKVSQTEEVSASLHDR